MKTPHLAVAAFLALSSSALSQIATQAQSATAGPQSNSLQAPGKSASPAIAANYGKLPLSFEANQGQADPRARFLSHGNGYSLFLTDTAAVLELSKPDSARQGPSTPKAAGMNPAALAKARRPVAMKTDIVRMELAGAAHNAPVAGADPLPGKANYLIGKDSTKWHTNIPTYGKVKYNGVYPGVDLVYYGNQQQLEYDFILAPGASAKPLKLHFAGATQLKLNSDGDLAVIARNTEIALKKPVVYQQKDGQRQPVEGKFTLLAKNTVGFQLGGYDRSRELVIDPVVVYSTYFPVGLGSIAVDSEGSAYVTGGVSSFFTPTKGAYQTTPGTTGVVKLNPAGTAVVYATYFGPSYDYQYFPAGSIAVDSSGDAYFISQNNFVTRLNATGSAVIYSTELPGVNITAIALDSAGHAYVTGTAYGSSNGGATLPVTPGAFQTVFKGTPGQTTDAFVTEFNAQGTGLIYSTYLSGSGGGYATSIAVDSQGSAYVTGAAGSDSPSPTAPI